MNLRYILKEELVAFYDELGVEFWNIKESREFPELFSLSNWVEGAIFEIQIELSNKEKITVT